MLQCYDFVKCGTCGIPWNEHDSSCANHHFRDARIAGQATLTDRDKSVLKAAGWEPPAIIPSVYAPDAPAAPPPSLGSQSQATSLYDILSAAENGHV